MTFRDGINTHFIFEETQQERIVLFLLRDPLQERERLNMGVSVALKT